MTLVDLVAIALIALYAILGWFSGTIRRVIGLLGFYIAALVATNMGQPGAGILRQYNPTVSVPDARLAGWLFFLVLLVIVFEAAATAVHPQLQMAVVALNRGVGVLLGLLTAVVAIVAVAYMLIGFANGQTNQPTGVQSRLRDELQHSGIVLPIARALGPALLPVLAGALPRDSQAFFIFEGPSPASR